MKTSYTGTSFQDFLKWARLQQPPILNRLRTLGVPEDLIQAGVKKATAENAIVAWCVREFNLRHKAVLRVLDGSSTLEQEKNRQVMS